MFYIWQFEKLKKSACTFDFPTQMDLNSASTFSRILRDQLLSVAEEIDSLPFSWLHNGFCAQNIMLESVPLSQSSASTAASTAAATSSSPLSHLSSVPRSSSPCSSYYVIDSLELSWGPRFCDFFFLFINFEDSAPFKGSFDKKSVFDIFKSFVDGGGAPFSEEECRLAVPCLLFKLAHLAWYYAVSYFTQSRFPHLNSPPFCC
jgi:hypothetical protein